MRKLQVSLIGLALVSCGPSQAELDAEERAAAAEAEAAAILDAQEQAQTEADLARVVAETNAARIQELSQTIVSKLDPTGAVNYVGDATVASRWHVNFGMLDASRWEWTEQEEADAVGVNGSRAQAFDRLTYTVNPQDLSPTVEITTFNGMPAARITCRSSDCIHITGVSGGPDGNVAVDMYSDDNNFPSPNQSDARAVATAMQEIITLSSQ